MPKLLILFEGFLVWHITGKLLHILVTQVLQILQMKSCSMYDNVDYAGIQIGFIYRDFPVIITYILHIFVNDYYESLHAS